MTHKNELSPGRALRPEVRMNKEQEEAVKPKMIVHSRLRQARERAGLTQKQVGKLAKLAPAAVSHFECGQRLPSLPNLATLAVALRVSADWLLGLENSRKYVVRLNWPRTQRIPMRPTEDCK